MQTLVFSGSIYDFTVLSQQLVIVLGPNGWYMNGSSNSVELFLQDEVSLTQEVFEAIVQFNIDTGSNWDQAYYKWDATASKFTENVAACAADAKTQIDDEAGKARMRYLTSIPGQDATYIAKETQCRAYAAAGYPDDLTSYPWVKSEADATGLAAKAAADAIITQADQWVAVGCAIEKTRRGGKIDIDKKLKLSTIKTSLAATLAALQAI